MQWVTIHVVDHDESPQSGELVKLFIHLGMYPDTSLEKYTGSDGVAQFDFDGGSSVDVYVAGVCRLDGVDVDDDYIVSI